MKTAFIDNTNTSIDIDTLKIVTKAFHILGYETLIATDHLNKKERFLAFLRCNILYQESGNNSDGARIYRNVAEMIDISIWDFRNLMKEAVDSVQIGTKQSEEINGTKDKSSIGDNSDDRNADSLGPTVSASGDK